MIKPIMKTSVIDLHAYNSEIKRADGDVPYNGYLWPTEDWWPGHSVELRNRVPNQWHFGIIALSNGSFSIDGVVYHIENNYDDPQNGYYNPAQNRKVVFSTRREAIRTAAARLIREIRRSHYWGADRPRMVRIINWILSQVAIATSHKTTVIEYRNPPAVIANHWIGLPLFATANNSPSAKTEAQTCPTA